MVDAIAKPTKVVIPPRRELVRHWLNTHVPSKTPEDEMKFTLNHEHGKWTVRHIDGQTDRKRLIPTQNETVANIVMYFIESKYLKTGEVSLDLCGASEGSLAYYVIRYFERLLKKQRKERTIAKYKSCCAHILRYFGGSFQLVNLTAEKWEEYQSVRQAEPHDRGDGFSGKSLVNERIGINAERFR